MNAPTLLAGIQLTDPGAPAGQGVLYRSPGFDTSMADQSPGWQTTLRMGDRGWTLAVHPTRAYHHEHRAGMVWALGVVGLLLTLLLQILMLGMTGRTAVIQRQNNALKASEERYQRLFNDSPLPVWLYDAESLRFLMVNDFAVAHYGWSRDEFLQMRLSDVLAPDAAPAAGPMPDSISSCGDSSAPALSSTSRPARTCLIAPPWRYSTPTARVPSNRMRVACAPVMTCRLGRARCGVR